MRWLKFLLLTIGVGILIFIIFKIDLEETADLLYKVGAGFLLILLLYFLAFLIDTFTWQLTLTNISLAGYWVYRLFKLRLVGEAFNNLTPLAGMGGEPLKAILLKNYYEVGYQDGIASLILAKTINVIALIIFLALGFLFLLNSSVLDFKYSNVASIGLISLSLCIILLFFVQRFKIISTAGTFLSQFKFLTWLLKFLNHVEAVEDRLVKFYSERGGRLLLALMLALSNWLLGVIEIYLTMLFLGYPISLIDAWILESVVQLIRAGSFFIPASIGAQEGVFVIIGAALSGSPTAGFAAAIVRRIREVVWIGWGIVIFYFLKSNINQADLQQTNS